MATDDLRDERIGRRRNRRNGDAVSRLCQAWTRAGADLFSGSLRIAADLTDEVRSEECGGDRPRRRDR